jgi:hypothetical protein
VKSVLGLNKRKGKERNLNNDYLFICNLFIFLSLFLSSIWIDNAFGIYIYIFYFFLDGNLGGKIMWILY